MNDEMTKAEAAKFLSERLRPGKQPFSLRTIEIWCATKRLPNLKVGRSLIFSRSALTNWLKRQERNVLA